MIAAPAGLVLYYLRIPLPWILGPLSAMMVYGSWSGNRILWPVGLRDCGVIVIGYSMGRTVTGQTMQQVVAHLPAMFIVTFLTVAFCIAVGYITHRRTGISLASGVVGSMPGGLAQMILLSEEIEDTDMTVVALMQTVRLIAVVFIVPFVATYGIAHMNGMPSLPSIEANAYDLVRGMPAIAAAPLGAGLAYLLKFPTPFLLGPICGAAAAVLSGYPAPPVPAELLNLAMIFFGIHMGKGITLSSLRKLGKVFPFAVGGAVLLVFFTFFLSAGLTFFTSATLITAFLSTSPGGLAEMGVIGLALNADTAFVLAYQLFRVFSLLLLVPSLLKWRFKRR